jgi:hypothetical protein
LLEALAPDVEWTEAAGFPYGGKYHGTAEVLRNVLVRLATEWEGFRPDVESFFDAGETIVVTGFYRGTFKATGRAMEASFAHVLTLNHGKIVRFVQYVDSRKVWDAMSGA